MYCYNLKRLLAYANKYLGDHLGGTCQNIPSAVYIQLLIVIEFNWYLFLQCNACLPSVLIVQVKNYQRTI